MRRSLMLYREKPSLILRNGPIIVAIWRNAVVSKRSFYINPKSSRRRIVAGQFQLYHRYSFSGYAIWIQTAIDIIMLRQIWTDVIRPMSTDPSFFDFVCMCHIVKLNSLSFPFLFVKKCFPDRWKNWNICPWNCTKVSYTRQQACGIEKLSQCPHNKRRYKARILNLWHWRKSRQSPRATGSPDERQSSQ